MKASQGTATLMASARQKKKVREELAGEPAEELAKGAHQGAH